MKSIRKISEVYMLETLTWVDESMDDLSDDEFLLAEDCLEKLLTLRDTVQVGTPKSEKHLVKEIREICIRTVPFMAIHMPPVPAL